MKRNHFLTRLLQTIVAQYGHEEVLRTLTHLPHMDNRSDATSQLKIRARSDQTPNREVAKPKRPTAIAQVTKATFQTNDREVILALASKFDRKEFLPSVGDIREFLAMAGNVVEGMKDRTEGFRHLLPVLVKLPPERLKRLANSDSHSGPAQLGPLADAIRSAGEARRQGDQPSNSSPTAISSGGSPDAIASVSVDTNNTTPEPNKT